MVYYLIFQKNGDLYLAQGTEIDIKAFVHFIYKLEEEYTSKEI